MTKTGKATYASARSKYLVASQEHKTGSICAPKKTGSKTGSKKPV